MQFDERVYVALEHDNVLAAILARLYLHIEGERLPLVGEVTDAWVLYCQTWRPVETRRQEWDGSYARAMDAISAPV